MADRNRLNRCCGNKTKTPKGFSYQYCSSRLNNFPRPSQPGSLERGLGIRLGKGWAGVGIYFEMNKKVARSVVNRQVQV